MKNVLILFGTVCVMATWLTSPAHANPGLRQVFRASQTMESGVEACAAKLQGKAFIDCVANELNKYSGRLGQKGAEKLVPQAAPNAAQTAASVRGNATTAAASSVLNRAASIMNGLAASSEKEVKRGYSRIEQAYNRAATIVGSKS
jgi:hypothetical protein